MFPLKAKSPASPAGGSKLKASGGYVALVSALMVTVAIAVIVTALGQVSFFGRSAISDTHLKEKSRALAGACVSTAFFRLANNPNYGGDETVTVASDTCQIFAVVSSSTSRVVEVQGIFGKAYTNLRVTVDSDTVEVLKWEELKSF